MPRPAMGDHVRAVGEAVGQVAQRRQDRGRVGDGAVGDGDGDEAQAGRRGGAFLLRQAQFVAFGPRERADQHVDTRPAQPPHPGPVRRIFAGPGRLARHLATLSESA